MEKSYRQISFNEAARMLYLSKPEEVKEMANKVIEFERKKTKRNETVRICSARMETSG